MLNFLRRQWYPVLVVALLLLAFGLRFYKLGEVPHGMTWDEAAVGYNGYAILHTRRDEWLQKLPVSFRSFGDYKAPGAIYLNGFSTAILGMNLLGVRAPFALFGVAAVLGMILLVVELGKFYRWGSDEPKALAIIAGLILATSPWHLHYSRTGFESGMALSLVIWGVYFLLRALRASKMSFFWLVTGAVSLVGSLYTYHSTKIVLPLLLLVFFWQWRTQLFAKWRQVMIAILVGGALLQPLLKDSLYGKGLERAGTLIISNTNSIGEFLSLLTTQFLAHLTPSFLVMGETHSLRHGDGQWGILLWPVFVLVILGLGAAVKKKMRGEWWLAILWIVIGILPAALGSELVPHSNRALLALPGFILLAIIGLRQLSAFILSSKINAKISGSHGEKNMVWVSVMGMLLLLQGLFFARYLSDYYGNFARNSAPDFNDGYLEAFNYVKEYESKVEKIVFESEYGQPYIYALFARKTNPIWYQGGSLIKYEFKEVTVGDLSREKAVIVAGGSNSDLKTQDAQKVVYGSDGQARFKIYLRLEQD